MADGTNQNISSEDVKWAKDYYNLELEINKARNERKNTLLEEFNIQKDVSRSVLNYLNKSAELRDSITKATRDQQSAEIKWRDAVSETDKREIEQTIKSIAQRKAGYVSDLDHLNKIYKSRWLPILFVIDKTFKLFKQTDAAAWQFRKTMGFTRDAADQVRKVVESISVELMHLGVTFEGVYSTVIALGKEMGSIHSISEDLIKTTSILKSQLGVSEEDSAGFFKNMAGVSKSSMDTQENMAYIAADMAAAAGVPFAEIMKDIGKASGHTLTMMSRIPTQIVRATIELKKMGTSIKEAASSSREMLNFSDNIAAEMEASVLLGRSINLQKARELAYSRDLEGSTKEILRLTKSVNFEGLDVFQQEAYARATGKTVDELLKMVVAERQWEQARRDPTLSGKVKEYERLRDLNKQGLMSESERLKLMIQTKSNQERITSISNKWNQIMAKLGQAFLPIIDVALGIVPPLMDLVTKWAPPMMVFGKDIANLFSKIGNVILNWSAATGKFVGFFSKVSIVASKVGGWFGKIFTWISKVVPFAAKFIGTFAKGIPVIGWIITGAQFIYNLFKRFGEIEFVKGDWTGNIWKGIKAIGGAVYDTLLKPFVDAWKWIKGIFVGQSPSQLGLGIVKGIVSVQGMLFDAVTAPFRKGLAWIADKIPGMSKVADKLRGGVSDIINRPAESRAAASYVNAATITADGIKVNGVKNNTPKSTSTKEEESSSSKGLSEILGAINRLNKNLEEGKIGFYLDGQLLSSTLARQTEFRNGYGVNRV